MKKLSYIFLISLFLFGCNNSQPVNKEVDGENKIKYALPPQTISIYVDNYEFNAVLDPSYYWCNEHKPDDDISRCNNYTGDYPENLDFEDFNAVIEAHQGDLITFNVLEELNYSEQELVVSMDENSEYELYKFKISSNNYDENEAYYYFKVKNLDYKEEVAEVVEEPTSSFESIFLGLDKVESNKEVLCLNYYPLFEDFLTEKHPVMKCYVDNEQLFSYEFKHREFNLRVIDDVALEKVHLVGTDLEVDTKTGEVTPYKYILDSYVEEALIYKGRKYYLINDLSSKKIVSENSGKFETILEFKETNFETLHSFTIIKDKIYTVDQHTGEIFIFSLSTKNLIEKVKIADINESDEYSYYAIYAPTYHYFNDKLYLYSLNGNIVIFDLDTYDYEVHKEELNNEVLGRYMQIDHDGKLYTINLPYISIVNDTSYEVLASYKLEYLSELEDAELDRYDVNSVYRNNNDLYLLLIKTIDGEIGFEREIVVKVDLDTFEESVIYDNELDVEKQFIPGDMFILFK